LYAITFEDVRDSSIALLAHVLTRVGSSTEKREFLFSMIDVMRQLYQKGMGHDMQSIIVIPGMAYAGALMERERVERAPA